MTSDVKHATAQDRPARPGATRKASDASGINPDERTPIHPKMPHLPPA